uniref:Uncharacterized protein n=1 Tax=Arundo donax TaxID=35708 RepID=A0A0A9BLE4_ARUDO
MPRADGYFMNKLCSLTLLLRTII